MRLNSIKPGLGSKKAKVRVGRGIGSTLGKTAGRGHKGQHARSGGFHKVGFEGGQMPLQRRLPKVGFRSIRIGLTTQVGLKELSSLDETVIDREVLIENGLVGRGVLSVKVMLNGKPSKSLSLRGLQTTKGARLAIESAGGNVGDV